ncbi:MAG TPA: hypothetical protein VHE14_03750, partial [Solirubrobacteraceae bacterium]|nr:hypothetical protein [Solirubrobacteraceae bacterium]
AAFVPVLLALVVVAFSLQAQPRTVTSSLAPDAFDGKRALGELAVLGAQFPRRRPGSAGDQALARRVAKQLRTTGGGRVSERRFRAQTIDGRRTLSEVVAVKPGLLTRRIVIVAARDAADAGATAQLSGTATLLELARVFAGRAMRKTIVLASVSGGSGGAAGARRLVGDLGGPVDAAIVLGDLAGAKTRSPEVVPWSSGPQQTPVDLRRTLELALRQDTGIRSREPSAFTQWARMAFPMTPGSQGELLARGLPAAELQVSGERGPGGEQTVVPVRVNNFGRAVLRSITALDARGAAPRRATGSVVIARTVLPPWAVRLLVGILILPVAIATIDGLARARRRRERMAMWLSWALSAALPFLAAAGLAIVLGLTGAIAAAPRGPATPGAIPFGGRSLAMLGVVVLVLVLAWVGGRPLLLRALKVHGDRREPGAAAATTLVLTASVIALWVANPFAAALLVPGLHLWLLVVAPEIRMRRLLGFAVVLVGLLPVPAVIAYAGTQLGFGLGDQPHVLLLLLAGGYFSPLVLLAWTALLGGVACALTITLTRPEAAAVA